MKWSSVKAKKAASSAGNGEVLHWSQGCMKHLELKMNQSMRCAFFSFFLAEQRGEEQFLTLQCQGY